MSRHTGSLPPAYFETKYEADPDPWRFATSDYERDKYAATLAALPRARYHSALEVGCSVGVFTASLAGRCDDVLGLDVAEVALATARRRCADLSHVRFEVAQVPGDWPGGRYDLVVLSEVVYYLDGPDVARLAARVREVARPEADLILVHWLGETDYPLTGDAAAEAFIAAASPFARVTDAARTGSYRLDVLRTGPA